MHPVLKWSGVVTGALLGLMLLGAGRIYFTSETIIARAYVPQVAMLRAVSPSTMPAAAGARGAVHRPC